VLWSLTFAGSPVLAANFWRHASLTCGRLSSKLNMPFMPADILISLDDKNLFFSNWLRGDIVQLDVTNPSAPKFKSRVWLGGSIAKGGGVTVSQEVSDVALAACCCLRVCWRGQMPVAPIIECGRQLARTSAGGGGLTMLIMAGSECRAWSSWA
jgi:hypothetical protein